MQNIRCVVEYDGTDFRGFQRQPVATTIQGTLEDAIRELTREHTRVVSAGRTDAGVHALGQVISFHTSSSIPVERWPDALNSRLPRTIVVKKADIVPPEFHAGRSATAKLYRYTIRNARHPSVFDGRYALFVRQPLDVEAMARAAALLAGRRDFAAFRAAGSTPVRTTVRHLFALDVTRREEHIYIDARGDGFLYHMVRNIVGTLLLVGEQKRPIEWVGEVLDAGRRELAGPTAPAHGLCLVRVEYG